jgi:hypothetical protein
MWIFFIFQPSKIHISTTGIIFSLFPPRCCISFGRRRHAATSCYASFPLRQDELSTSVLSFDNALSHHLSSQAKNKALNPYHRHMLHSLDRLTTTIHCYKKIISTLVTLPITQPRLYFIFSLARAPRHQSSIRHHYSLSPLSHGDRSST